MHPFSEAAPVVGRRYRLRPEDLLSDSVEATITNVSMEGLEVLHPVLHFDRLAKPMALNPETANDLAHVTHSAIPEEWIGQRVQIAAVDDGGDLRLTILAPSVRVPPPVRLTRRSSEARRQRTRSLLIALVVLLIVLAVYLLENSTLITDVMQMIFGSG